MDRPILFSGPMVRALLDGRKTQTRRVAQTQTGLTSDCYDWSGPEGTIRRGIVKREFLRVPYSVGDRLYVREAWRTGTQEDATAPRNLDRCNTYIGYEADCALGCISATGKFRQAMHMPRWASRLTLIVTDVRVQRLQDCTVQDAVAEGALVPPFSEQFASVHALPMYQAIWNGLNADRGFGWETNPWIVAVTFTVHRGNIDATLRSLEAGKEKE